MRRLSSLCAVLLCLALAACELPLSRGRETLGDLLNPGSRKPTLVYSRWTELTSRNGARWPYLIERLRLLHYRDVPRKMILKPGDYSADYPDLYVYTRPFRYPDQPYPAQWIRLHFSSDQLDRIETLPQKNRLDSWRLEPMELAVWGAAPSVNRPRIKLTDLPPYVPQAIVAMEDKRFYQHGAFDWIGILRALAVDLQHGGFRQGASTISQQLARSLFLSVDRTWTRKISEAFIALYLEMRFSKPQLLGLYLNQVYWGQDGGQSLLGLAEASQSYFGKPAEALTPGQAALLAGLLQSPNRFSPRAYPQVALDRRSLVLRLMKEQGFLSDSAYRAALEQPLQLAPVGDRKREAPYFVAMLQDELSERYSLRVLLNQGWVIFTTLDPVLQQDAVRALQPPLGQGALVALEPASGAIRAWVGGVDYAHNPFDRVIRAQRQPGSAFKPFVVLAAIDTRTATASTRLEDKPLVVQVPGGPWVPQNYDRKFRGAVSVSEALIHSYNVPMVRLALQVGIPTVAEYARRCGIGSPLHEVPSLALGTSETTPLELTGAYAALANGGRYNPPYMIETILDPDGRTFETHIAETRDAVPPESAYVVTHMLQDVLNEGTGKAARAMGLTQPAAGKTGTSENFQDAWFLGYTPELACGVWIGFDHPAPLGHSAAGIALPLWVSFMESASNDLTMSNFAEPSSVVARTIDTDTGFVARTGCPHHRIEYFLPGTVPPDCPVHPGGLKGLFFRFEKWSNSR